MPRMISCLVNVFLEGRATALIDLDSIAMAFPLDDGCTMVKIGGSFERVFIPWEKFIKLISPDIISSDTFISKDNTPKKDSQP